MYLLSSFQVLPLANVQSPNDSLRVGATRHSSHPDITSTVFDTTTGSEITNKRSLSGKAKFVLVSLPLAASDGGDDERFGSSKKRGCKGKHV
jgi:hypothetical protein